MPKNVQTNYQSKVQKPADFEAFWEGCGVRKPPCRWSPRWSSTRSERRRMSRCSRYFITASTTCASPPGIADPAHGRSAARRSCSCRATRRTRPFPRNGRARAIIALSVAPRGKLRSNRQFNPGYPNLLTHNIVDPPYLRLSRLLRRCLARHRFLAVPPEVDSDAHRRHRQQPGRRLDHHAPPPCGRKSVPRGGCPYLCGFMDAIELTHTYPYEEINDYLRQYPERRPAVRRRWPTSMASISPTASPARSSSTSASRTMSARRRPAMRCSTALALPTSNSTPTTAMATMRDACSTAPSWMRSSRTI